MCTCLRQHSHGTVSNRILLLTIETLLPCNRNDTCPNVDVHTVCGDFNQVFAFNFAQVSVFNHNRGALGNTHLAQGPASLALHLVVDHVRLQTACMAERVQVPLSGAIPTLCCQPPGTRELPTGLAGQISHLHQAYVPGCSRILQ